MSFHATIFAQTHLLIICLPCQKCSWGMLAVSFLFTFSELDQNVSWDILIYIYCRQEDIYLWFCSVFVDQMGGLQPSDCYITYLQYGTH